MPNKRKAARTTRPCKSCGGTKTCRWTYVWLIKDWAWNCNRCDAVWTTDQDAVVYAKPRTVTDLKLETAERTGNYPRRRQV